ncbi:MAG: hypothetical protein M3T56_12645 [Chloroflexota bacterium]|nr:hypothetical protein [Chloroflexota bacterium]
MELVTLRIDQLIVHDVPQRLAAQRGGAPVLSDVPSPLDADIRAYFAGRLTQTLARHASAVEHDPGTSSKVPEELVALLTRPLFATRSTSSPGAAPRPASSTGRGD